MRLAAALGVSRTAVWKALHGISELGLELHSVPKRGYRLSQPIEALTRSRIEKQLPTSARQRLRKLEILAEIDSTNSHLLAVSDLPPGARMSASLNFNPRVAAAADAAGPRLTVLVCAYRSVGNFRKARDRSVR